MDIYILDGFRRGVFKFFLFLGVSFYSCYCRWFEVNRVDDEYIFYELLIILVMVR